MWYRVLVAARFQGVAPWDLGSRSIGWLHMIEDAAAIEAKTKKAPG